MTTLEAFIDELAARVADKIAERVPKSTSPRYADTKHNPLGSAGSFLAASRRGDFPSFVRGRRVTALWSDVEAYVERRQRRPRVSPADEDDRAALEGVGVKLRRVRR